MIDFPNGFTQHTTPLVAEQLDDQGTQALHELTERGYEVHSGLTHELASQILLMSQEPNIREYCPKDATERFSNLDITKRWLSKKRAVFLLFERHNTDLRLVGYGWSGMQDNVNVPGGESTFALRIGQAGQGRGLATPFARTILSASANIYNAKNMWLETWASNGGAVHIYNKLGFVTMAKKPDERLRPSGETVADTRLYMTILES